jgi:hypothetical protein
MSDHAHFNRVRCNAEARLRVGVKPVGFRAEKSKEGEHILHLLKDSATCTCSNKFGGTSGIGNSGLLDRTPHEWSAIDENGISRNAEFVLTHRKGSISITKCVETMIGGEGRWDDDRW